ncbi:alanine racemase [Helicobacter enhydrae]|uniref:Alanine racemase n=1 Tax=Helicobacter enhydrae TaxID=222136 RepID=A0A1B1U7F7_9HELI|nr:alanine racemase [Helicobacter enhydrae]ANV98605.1 alanine racemase [Helicobacter enhydrae]
MAQLLISKHRFKHNLDLISRHIGTQDNIAIVLKDNAYGHGIKEIASIAKEYGIKNAFVKNDWEARQIQGDFEHITVLYGDVGDDMPPHIYQTIHSLESLHTIHPQRKVELKCNTGMNRNGLELEELEQAFVLAHKRQIEIIGVFSHNGYGDEGDENMLEQYQKAQELKSQTIAITQKLGLKLPRFHNLNSSSAMQLPPDGDIVRIGIALYGYLCTKADFGFQPIASLWAKRISTRQLKAGAKVGYGGVGIVPQDCSVSTYDLGYGDGLLRLNEHFTTPLRCANGAIILPKMSMDCFSCLSDEEEICLFEDASLWAQHFDTIPYDILTKLSPYITRKIIQ